MKQTLAAGLGKTVVDSGPGADPVEPNQSSAGGSPPARVARAEQKDPRVSWSEAKRDRKDPGWRDRGQRAYANGISLDAQRIVDGAIQFEDGPLFQALDRHYVKLAQEHDLSLALLERLRQRPYWRLGNEIADLPAAQFQRIAREVEVLAQDRTASALTREEAVRALGRVSQPRVERNGELLARPSDLEGLTRLEFRGQSEALREMLAGELTEENRMRARKLLKRVDPSFR